MKPEQNPKIENPDTIIAILNTLLDEREALISQRTAIEKTLFGKLNEAMEIKEGTNTEQSSN